jgi:hypothetical protein
MPASHDPTPTRSPTRQLLLAALLIAVATGVYFREFVTHPRDLLVGVHADGRNDLTTAFLRYRDESATLSSRHGEFADWNPHIQMGVPIHGNAQAGLFYPPNWLVAFFGAEHSLSWIMVGHMWWAGLGSFVLLLHVRLSFLAALFGGVLTAGTPYAIAHLAEGHYAQICVFAWLPWICWRFEAFLTSNGTRWKLLSAFVAIGFFAGHVQELYYLMLLLTGCVVFRGISCRSRGETSTAKSLLTHWCLMAAACGALVAVDLIPILLNNQTTARAGKLPIELAGDGLTLLHLKQLFNPMSFGGPENLKAPTDFYWKKLAYFGVLNLALAVLAILTLKSSDHPARTRWMWITLVCVLFAFGQRSPVFQAAFHGVPMIGSFRVPSRVLFIGSLVLFWLAALQIHTCSRNKLESQEPRATPRWRVSLAVVLILACVSELAWHSSQVIATIKTDQFRNGSKVVQSVSNRGARNDKTTQTVSASDFDRVMSPQSLLSDLETLHSGVYRVRGYEPVLQKRYAVVMDALFHESGTTPDFGGFNEAPLDRLNAQMLDLLGVRYFVSTIRQGETPGWKLIRRGLIPPTTILRGQTLKEVGYGIYENEDRLPRAFVVGHATPIKSPENFKASIQQLASIDCRNTVLLTKDVLPQKGPRQEFEPAEIISYKSDSVTINVEIDAPGYLVLTDLFHPGWTAQVDGKATAIIPAYTAFRAVPLTTADKHKIEFRYTTPGRTKGAILSVVTAILLAIAAFKSRTSTAV